MSRTAKAYAHTQSATASPERLMVLLFEKATRCIRAGAEAAEGGDRSGAAAHLTKATEIVTELKLTLDHGAAPELCAQLSDLYGFTISRLIAAALAGDAAKAREAERAFAPVAEAFSAAVATIAKSDSK
ncbi:MAG TPA: flagellar export chaperone FliS [Vulgatibacter sp.]|nr:flagellar export chaperone FliS [Vulgatibacter sp.]